MVTGEAESVWAELLEDARHGRLKPRYEGGLADLNDLAPARHDLLPARYAFGAIQITRGCPLNCNFCSVTTFNGAQYRQRPIPDVVREFRSIPEKRVLVVDDNLIGTRAEHIARAKDLFRALAQASLRKEWVAQATINFADDEELLALAAKAGVGVCSSVSSPRRRRPARTRQEDQSGEGPRLSRFRAPDTAAQHPGRRFLHRRFGRGRAGHRPTDCGGGQPLRLGQSQYPVSDALTRHAAMGPDESGGPHCPRSVSGRLEILHADLPGGSVQAALVGWRHPGNGLLQPTLLLSAADTAPGLEEHLASSPAADQPGGQSFLPEQHSRGLPGLREFSAAMARFLFDLNRKRRQIRASERI